VITNEWWLSTKPPVSSRYMFGILSAHAESLLTRLESSTTTRGQVEGLLMPSLHTGRVGMQTIADKLSVSRQALLRRL